MAYDENLAERIRELLVGESDVTEKKMFGGLAFLIGGNMAVAASGQGGVMVRVGPAKSDRLVSTTNARLVEMRGRAMQGWLRIDPDDVRTKRQLAKWVSLGTTCARSLPARRSMDLGDHSYVAYRRVDDVQAFHDRALEAGAEITKPLTDEPWGMREIHVRDPNEHVIRFGHGIPMREPKMEIERVPLETRIEKRLAALMGDLARHKNMTVGEMLEEIFLHSFEKVSSGGVASPHTEKTLACIQELKRKHGIDYETHASYRFVEKTQTG